MLLLLFAQHAEAFHGINDTTCNAFVKIGHAVVHFTSHEPPCVKYICTSIQTNSHDICSQGQLFQPSLPRMWLQSQEGNCLKVALDCGNLILCGKWHNCYNSKAEGKTDGIKTSWRELVELVVNLPSHVVSSDG